MADKPAGEIARARDELVRHAADVAHVRRELERLESAVTRDLSEPLRVTAGFAQLLMTRYDGDLDPVGQLLLAGLERSTRRMQAVLDGLV